MELLSAVWTYLVPFIIVLTILVFCHEMGHYLVARWFGVAIDTFSIGFGREIARWHDAKGTCWRIGLLPLGGYVKFLDDSDVGSSKPSEVVNFNTEERKRLFHNKPISVRTAVVAAGPIANFLLTIILLAGLYGIVGQPFTPPIIDSVLPDTAASSAGFKPGDKIVEVDGLGIDRFEELQQFVISSPEQLITVVVERNNQNLTLEVIPGVRVATDNFGQEHRIGYLGVQRSGIEFIKHDPLSAIWYSVGQTYSLTVMTLRYVGDMIMGLRSTDDLRGPIGIMQMSGQAAQVGVSSFVQLIAVLSISLGLINLFPIPVLDGGHLLFYAVEALRGKPLGERAQEYAFRAGLALIFGLMLMATWNDLVHSQFFNTLVHIFS